MPPENEFTMSTLKQQRIGHAALLGSNVMWGIMAPISKFVLAGGIISATALTDIRLFGGTLLFWIASLFFKREKVDRKDYIKLFGAGFFSTALNQVLFVKGVSLTSPVDASICTSTLPIWTMLMAAAFLKEPITGKKAGGVLLGLSGALILVLFGAHSASGSSNIWGDVLCLASQMSYGVYLVFFQDVIKKYSPVTLMKWKYTFGSLMLLPFSFRELPSTDWASLPSMQWAGLGYVLIFGTFLAYLIVPLGQKHLRPTVVAMYNYLQPVTATVIALLWGLDSFSIVKVLAVVLIFTGVLMVNRSKAKESAPSTPTQTSPQFPEIR